MAMDRKTDREFGEESTMLDFRLIVNTIPGLVCTLTPKWN